MGEYTIDDPVEIDTKNVPKSGQLYLGGSYEGKRVRYVIESVEDVDGEGEPDGQCTEPEEFDDGT